MPVQNQQVSMVAKLTGIFGDWLQYRRSIREIESRDSSAFKRVAEELGITSRDLETMILRGPHAADELPKMLEALGISADAISRVQPLVYHDMERVCALCVDKGRCNRDLASGTSAKHYEDYCCNATTIDALTPKSS